MPGKRRKEEDKTCDWCHGKGTIEVPKGPPANRHYVTETCNRCRGTGKI